MYSADDSDYSFGFAASTAAVEYNYTETVYQYQQQYTRAGSGTLSIGLQESGVVTPLVWDDGTTHVWPFMDSYAVNETGLDNYASSITGGDLEHSYTQLDLGVESFTYSKSGDDLAGNYTASGASLENDVWTESGTYQSTTDDAARRGRLRPDGAKPGRRLHADRLEDRFKQHE